MPISSVTREALRPHQAFHFAQYNWCDRICTAYCTGQSRKWKTIPDFSAGQGVKNLPGNAEDTGLIPGPGRSPMPQSN